MEITYRHAKLLKHVVTRGRPRGLVHGNTGRRPFNAINLDLTKEIRELSRIHTPLLKTRILRKACYRARNSDQSGDGQEDSEAGGYCSQKAQEAASTSVELVGLGK
jgi:hypothetical protein